MCVKPHLIHIGLPKCASTFLQTVIFPNIKEVDIYINSFTERLPKHMDFIYRLSVNYDSLKDQDGKECQLKNEELLQASLGTFKVKISEKRHLISSEGLVGSVLNPALCASQLSNYLGQSAPNSRILIVVRNQKDWMQSIYKQMFVMRQGILNSPEFNVIYGDASSDALIKYRELDWSLIASTYIREFGDKNVFVIPYELLRQDPNRFLKILRDWAEVDIDVQEGWMNKIVDPNHLSIKKIVKEFQSIVSLGDTIKNIMRINSLRKKHAEYILGDETNVVLEELTEANKNLQNFCTVDLKKLGYF
jgi:hypothetical protein